MKKILSTFFTCSIFVAMNAQISLPIKVVNTPAALQQAITGLTTEFANTKGEAVTSAPQQTDFVSKIIWPDSETNVVSTYSATKQKNITGNVSWQSIVKTTEEYKDAIKIFKKTFSQIDGAKITFNGVSYKLNAKYETPDENVGFSTILFEVGEGRALQVLLELASDNTEWQVKLSIYEITKE